MSELQVWTVIGVFATALFGMLGFLMSSLTRTIRVEITSLRTEMNARFDAVNTRFDAVNNRFEHLDQDVQFLMRKEFGDNPNAN